MPTLSESPTSVSAPESSAAGIARPRRVASDDDDGDRDGEQEEVRARGALAGGDEAGENR